MPDPLKKTLDLSQKIVLGVEEGQSEDAPIDIPGTHKERDADDPNHVTVLRTGQKERRGKAPETIRDIAPDER